MAIKYDENGCFSRGKTGYGREVRIDQPVIVRYASWLKGAFSGDLGTSFTSNEPVVQRIAERLPYTIELTFFTIIISIIIGIPVGILSAIKRGSVPDHIINFLA